ncbi:PREDICTED: probable cytochrome P450 309a1 [Rhagoletis zephyria]|uniref:probable cytochrome P450 309a1 n=1 Tax=Rhagoletis zephyria TaxID=28612 RepID=UPI0008116C3B|nr:PREDICTED: probable cytochrome P450 309a1 [Rhagoletis zephyria]
MISNEMEAILVTVGLLGAIILLVYKYLSWHHGVFKAVGLDGPKPNIFLGNFPSAITGKQPVVYDVDEVYSKYKNTHKAIGVFMTRNPQILILDPGLAQKIMVTNFGKFRGNVAADLIYNRKEDKIAAGSPFFTSDESWKAKRLHVVGGLKQSKLSMAYPIWKGCAKKLAKYLENRTANGNAIIETKNLGFCFTSNVLGEFLWGIETNAFAKSNEPNTFLEMSQKWLQYIAQSVTVYFKLLPVPWLRRFAQPRLFPLATDRFFTQLTKDALEWREKDESSQNRVDFLNYLRQLQEKKNLTLDDMVGCMLTTTLDGFETSATVLFHTIFYLAHHPQYQEKLRMEILANLEEDGSVSYQKLCALPYLNQCVNESIRLISVVSFYARISTEPTELEVGQGLVIPIKVGQVVSVPVFSFHHNPDHFPKPYEFNPDRFNNEAHLDLMKRGIFMPFGNGPRICAGMHLGLVEVKTCLVEIFKAYRVNCCAKTIPEKRPESPTFIMGIDGEFWLEYERL